MTRVILHSDANSFYASVETLYDPTIRDKPVAVCGDPQARHGIVLTKNQIAKKYGIQTGEAIWQAKIKCPQLVVVKPDYELYLKFSSMLRSVYLEYSPLVESFGLDEAWVDISHRAHNMSEGESIAHTIRERIKHELGITVSIGVSDNKVFAKLASDYKKRDAVTVIGPDNYKQIAWSLPVKRSALCGTSYHQ